MAFDSTLDRDRLPVTPVLTILQLKFRLDVNLDDASQPASGLWRSSVEFISTIPGFQGLYWAPESKSSIIILIQWDSGLAWKRFQCSMGFSMLLGYLDRVYNRCVQIALPGQLASSRFRLELVSYEFPARSDAAQHASTDEGQGKFKTRWESMVKSHVNDGLVHAGGGWIEEDVQPETQYFIGLVFWKSDTQLDTPKRQLEASDQSGTDKLGLLTKEATAVVSCVTEYVRYEDISLSQEMASVPVSVQSNLKHPLLHVPTTRRCDVIDLDSLQREDRGHLETLEASTTPRNKRIAPGPAGGWFSMGSLSQHHMPALPQPGPTKMVEMISFFVRDKSSHFNSVFADFRASLWKLRHRPPPPVRWGTDAEDTARTFVMADLGDIKCAPVQTQELFHQLVRNFETVC